MKKITVRFIAEDSFHKSKIIGMKEIKQVNEYDEAEIKHNDDLSTYSFDFLIDSAKLCVKGIIQALKGFGGMSMWAIVTIIEGIKFMFKSLNKKKEDRKNVKVNVKVKN